MTVGKSANYAATTGGRRMKGKTKEHQVMSEFKRGKLHSGSKSGPKVTKRKQAIAIALSEAGKGRKGKSDEAMLKRHKMPM